MSNPLHWRQMFTLGPSDRDHLIASRAALGVFLPLVLLMGLDRLDLAVFAIFAAFTGIYGRAPTHRDRVAAQVRSGLLLLTVIVFGWASSAFLVEHGTGVGSWTLVALTTLVAWACSLATGFLRIRPGGSLFHIFAFAAIASIPEVPRFIEAVGTSAAVVLLCVLIGVCSWVLPARRTGWVRTAPEPLSPNVRRAIWIESVGYVLAAGIAGAVATLLSDPLNVGHGYWAMVAAVVPLAGHTTRHRVARGFHRILGTVAGLVVMAGVILVNPGPWGVVLFIGVMQFCAELLIARNYFWAQVCVTPLALVGTSLAAGLGPSLVYDRMVETVIGAMIGVAVVLGGSAYGNRMRRSEGLAAV